MNAEILRCAVLRSWCLLYAWLSLLWWKYDAKQTRSAFLIFSVDVVNVLFISFLVILFILCISLIFHISSPTRKMSGAYLRWQCFSPLKPLWYANWKETVRAFNVQTSWVRLCADWMCYLSSWEREAHEKTFPWMWFSFALTNSERKTGRFTLLLSQWELFVITVYNARQQFSAKNFTLELNPK